jgi:amidase
MGAVVEGAITRTMADAAASLDAMAGPDPLAWFNAPAQQHPFAEEVGAPVEKLRIGLMAEAPLGLPTDPDCVQAARQAAALLEELGHELVEVEVATISEELTPDFVTMTIGGIADYDGVDWSKVEPHSRHAYEAATDRVSAYEYVVAVQRLERLSRREVARWGRDFDVLLTPTSAILAPAAGSILAAQHATPDQPVVETVQSVCFSAFGNITGLPGLSLPLHSTPDGLPVGVMFTGAPFDESSLLRLGAQLEEARPWAERLAASAA